MARVRASLASELSSARTAAGSEGWSSVDDLVQRMQLPVDAACSIVAQPVGIARDINALDTVTLRHVLVREIGSATLADSLVAAFLDWVDANAVLRENGAEREWYAAAGRPGPRNGPLAHRDELNRIRGWENYDWSRIFGTEQGRVALSHASAHVLASLPGMTTELADLIVSARKDGGHVPDLLVLAERLGIAARDTLMSRYGELMREAAFTPDGWLLISRASGFQGSAAVLEVRVGPGNGLVVPVRRRTWVE